MTAEQLKEERKKREYTQKEMADFLGVKHSTYIKWENDKTRKKPVPFLVENRLKEKSILDLSILDLQEITELDLIARSRGVTMAALLSELLKDGLRRAKEAAAAGLSLLLLCVFCHQVVHPEENQARRFGRRRSETAMVAAEEADAEC